MITQTKPGLGWTFFAVLLCFSSLTLAVGLERSASNAMQKNEIVIGGLFPLEFMYGWTPYRAMQIAVDEINAAGGIDVGDKKMPFKLVKMDTRDLEVGIADEDVLGRIEDFIIKEKPDFLAGGPNRSEIGVKMLDLVSKHKIIHILAEGVLTPAYHKKIESDYDKYKYGFRITSHGGVMANDFLGVTKYIREKYGLNKVYMMLQDVEHARKGGEIMNKMFLENGFEVVGSRTYSTGATDYSIGLLEAIESRAEILFIWMDMPESAILLVQWNNMKVKALPVGFVCPAEQPHFSEVTQGAGEYLIVNLNNAGNAPGHVTDWTMKFVNAYRERWSIEPEGYGASTGYMAPYLLKDAIERSGTLQTDAVIDALEQTNLMGVYGRIKFDKNSHQIVASSDPNEGAVTCVIQWQDGKRVQVYPPNVADAQIRLPDWVK